jgi:hypothetical protein
MTVPLPMARSYDEAMVYMELRPCACGANTADWSNALTHDDGWPARRYYATCPSCGTQRQFVFRLPERPLLPPPDTKVLFGGPEHSELLDAGEWLWLADMCARSAVPVRRDESGRPRYDAEAQESLEVAVAAMDEVLKFIPVDVDVAPSSAFWSQAGRQVRDREPGRFRRDRLEVVRGSYWDALHPEG